LRAIPAGFAREAETAPVRRGCSVSRQPKWIWPAADSLHVKQTIHEFMMSRYHNTLIYLSWLPHPVLNS
jgi:hypothetical protein